QEVRVHAPLIISGVRSSRLGSRLNSVELKGIVGETRCAYVEKLVSSLLPAQTSHGIDRMIAKLLGISQVIFLLPVEGTRVTEVRRTVWRADVDQIGRAVSLLVVVVLVKTKLCSQIQSRKDMESRIDVTKQFGTLSQTVLGSQYVHWVRNRFESVRIGHHRRVAPSAIRKLHREDRRHFDHRSSRHLVSSTLFKDIFLGAVCQQVHPHRSPFRWIGILG